MITLTRDDVTVSCLTAAAHSVHLSVSNGCVVADCICGLHAESFSDTREVFDFLASHEAGHLRSIPTTKGAFRDYR
jgi:hypothetical protein